MEFAEQLRRLCTEAKGAEEGGSGSVTDFEAELGAILSLCEVAQAEGRDDAVVSGLVAIGTGDIPAPYETLAFCLHRLRSAAVLRRLEEYSERLDHTSRKYRDFQQYLADLRDALSDDWRDRDIFTLYRAQ